MIYLNIDGAKGKYIFEYLRRIWVIHFGRNLIGSTNSGKFMRFERIPRIVSFILSNTTLILYRFYRVLRIRISLLRESSLYDANVWEGLWWTHPHLKEGGFSYVLGSKCANFLIKISSDSSWGHLISLHEIPYPTKFETFYSLCWWYFFVGNWRLELASPAANLKCYWDGVRELSF